MPSECSNSPIQISYMIIQSQIFSKNFLINECTKYNNLRKTFFFEKLEKFQTTIEIQQPDK